MNARQRLVLRSLDKYIEGLGELTLETLKPMSIEWYQFLKKWGVSPRVFVLTPTESPVIATLSAFNLEELEASSPTDNSEEPTF